mgnify:CR=1 FL=1
MATLPSIGGLHEYTVQEKLNKMAVDLIDVTIATDADAAGELLVTTTEIPNAVAVEGGTAILQSAMLMSNKVLTDSVDVVITSDSTTQGSIGDTVASSSVANTVMDGTCGFFSITNLFDAGAVAIGSKQNIGMVCKAAAGCTSLYVWMIAQGATDWDVDTGVLRLGFIQD